MKPNSRPENYQLFCRLARSYGVCDEVSGDDNHKRVRMGKDGSSRARYEVHSRKSYMKVFHDKTDLFNANDVKHSHVNIKASNSAYDYYSEIVPDDYDVFLRIVRLRLGRK